MAFQSDFWWNTACTSSTIYCLNDWKSAKVQSYVAVCPKLSQCTYDKQPHENKSKKHTFYPVFRLLAIWNLNQFNLKQKGKYNGE